ncbi:hypothetical protein INT47_009921 [Mucor saturninus]|uniref:BOD1/SHG1 domain-containing protein n=1 Tax=Mucor saturninus TaxID=64648 RepID=A0A8H7USL0_9FUNG|nr:hypothetical protein INT47_009921 [Mucor saturninus]
MKPEEIVLQLKKNGTFDDLRKRLLADFQSGAGGENFLEKLKSFMEDMVARDPSLIEKESSAFYELVSAELERAGIYNTIRQEALETLKGEQYQTRVNDEIKTLSGKTDNV